MQTFLPYPDIVESVKCLDNKRLGKQRVEAYQIHKALTIEDYGWKNHPITKMWKGYEAALLYYMNCSILEWIDRGFKNTMLLATIKNIKLPFWFGDDRIHSSHRANLIRKDPIYYGKFGWAEKPSSTYFWRFER